MMDGAYIDDLSFEKCIGNSQLQEFNISRLSITHFLWLWKVFLSLILVDYLIMGAYRNILHGTRHLLAILNTTHS